MPIDSPQIVLLCDRCNYDLRAQSPDGNCPECGYPVAESQRLSVIPRRPKWRDSDPRWRRRMIAGAWILTFVPLMDVLQVSEWSTRIPIPDPFHFASPLTLAQTYAVHTYEYYAFVIGIVLLFSKERNRRQSKLDATRRIGIVGSYGVAFLGIPHFLFIAAIVMLGIAASCMSLPLRNQPAPTRLYIELGAGYLRHGPHSTTYADIMLCAFSSVIVILACAPIYAALRSTVRKSLAVSPLIPLLLGAVFELINLTRFSLNFIPDLSNEAYCPFYFNPHVLAHDFPYPSSGYILEAGKWISCLTIASWLTIAQLKTWKKHPAF